MQKNAGRHDHMQLSTPSMLGCLLSHIQIWQTIQPNEIIAVFEEDAFLDKVSAERMHALSDDMKEIQWDLILLESGHGLIATGEWQHIGKYATTCSNKTQCTWFGTRGYLITHSGAQQLLRHTYPISVQVDALMGLLAAFSPDFKMYWTRENIAHLQLFHVSAIWDACFKCYLPTSPVLYILCILYILAVVARQYNRFTQREIVHNVHKSHICSCFTSLLYGTRASSATSPPHLSYTFSVSSTS
jgi:hypothetical protein